MAIPTLSRPSLGLRRLLYGLLAFPLAFSGFFSSLQSVSAESTGITPIAECTAVNPDGSYTGYFGYRNTSETSYSIPVGINNRLLGGTLISGTPVTEFPGNSEVRYPTPAFSVHFSAGAVVWSIRTPGHPFPDLAIVTANSHVTPRCDLVGDVTAPTITDLTVLNPAVSATNIYGDPHYLSDATGKLTIGGTITAGGTFADDNILTNVLGGVTGEGDFNDSEWTPVPTPNNGVDPVTQGQYLVTWNTKTGLAWRSRPDGTYTLFLHARDRGTQSGDDFIPQNTFKYIDVTVDNTAPTEAFTGITPAGGSVVTGNMHADVAFNDVNGFASTAISVNGTDVCTQAWPSNGIQDCIINTATFADGAETVTATSTDKAGNTTSIARTFIFDNAGPTQPELVSPANNAVMHSSVAQFMDWTDSTDAYSPPVSYEFALATDPTLNEDGSFVTTIFTTTTPVSNHTQSTEPGVYYWEVRAIDSSGNASSWTSPWKFTIDDTAPTLPVHLSPADGSTVTPAMYDSADWTDSSDDTGVSYYYESSLSPDLTEGGSFQTIYSQSGPLTASQVSTLGTPDGTYYWHVRAVDEAGNSTEWTDAWQVTVDGTAPAIPSPLTPANGIKTQGVAFTETWTPIADAVLYTYESCNVNPGDTGADCSSIRTTGTYATAQRNVLAGTPNAHFWWRVKAQDAVGNMSAFGPAFEIIVDNSAPLVTVTSVAGSITTNTSPSFTGTSADVYLAGLASTQYRIVSTDTNAVVTDWTATTVTDGDFSFTPASPLPIGNYSIEVRATDQAGNVSGTTRQRVSVIAAGVGGDNLPLPGASGGTQTAPPVQVSPTASPTVSPTASASPSASPTENGQVKGATTSTGSQTYWWWLLLIPILAFLYWWFFGKRKEEEEEQKKKK